MTSLSSPWHWCTAIWYNLLSVHAAFNHFSYNNFFYTHTHSFWLWICINRNKSRYRAHNLSSTSYMYVSLGMFACTHTRTNLWKVLLVRYKMYCWQVSWNINRLSFKHIEGFQPEWYISTMIYSWDIPFWLETLDMEQQVMTGLGRGTWERELAGLSAAYDLKMFCYCWHMAHVGLLNLQIQ